MPGDQMDLRPVACHVLWATSAQFPRPQFITAVNDGLVDSMREEADELIAQAKQWWEDFGEGGPWRYWLSVHEVTPHAPDEDEEEAAL